MSNRSPVNKLSLLYCKKYVKKYGGMCLSKEYIDIFHPLTWKCKNSHIWNTAFNNIKGKGHWCRLCAGFKNITIGDCISYAIKKNGKCLSKKYINARLKLKWECTLGHRWAACADKVINSKRWCPKCGRMAVASKLKNKKVLPEINKIAKAHGGKCLSSENEYKNLKTKLKFVCVNGHRWFSDLKHIRENKWCPMCRISKTQNDLAILIKEITGNSVIQNYKKFCWLKTKYGKMEIDIWVPNLKLAIEYDGEQHFFPVKFGGRNDKNHIKRYNRVVRLDKLKNKRIKKYTEDIKYFIRFNYKEKERLNKEYVKNKIYKIINKKFGGIKQ